MRSGSSTATGTWSVPANLGRIQLLSTTRLFLFRYLLAKVLSSKQPEIPLAERGSRSNRLTSLTWNWLKCCRVRASTAIRSGDWLFGIQKTEHSERSVHSQSRMRGVNGSGLTERTWSEPSSRFECKRQLT